MNKRNVRSESLKADYLADVCFLINDELTIFELYEKIVINIPMHCIRYSINFCTFNFNVRHLVRRFEYPYLIFNFE